MRRGEMEEAITGLLQREGVPYTLGRRRRHATVTFATPAGPRTYTWSPRPSDGRAMLNALAQIRRMLRGGS